MDAATNASVVRDILESRRLGFDLSDQPEYGQRINKLLLLNLDGFYKENASSMPCYHEELSPSWIQKDKMPRDEVANSYTFLQNYKIS